MFVEILRLCGEIQIRNRNNREENYGMDFSQSFFFRVFDLIVILNRVVGLSIIDSGRRADDNDKIANTRERYGYIFPSYPIFVYFAPRRRVVNRRRFTVVDDVP